MSCLRRVRFAGIRSLLAAVLGLLLVAVATACSPGGDAAAGNHTTATLRDLAPVPIAEDPVPALPVTVRSFDGSEVTVDDTSRIIAADRTGTLAQTVFALGLGDNMVGRSTGGTFPAIRDLPSVTGGSGSLNVESVAALEPTVFLTDSISVTPAMRDQLTALGITVVYFDPKRTMDGVVPQIQAVADALGVPEAGRALAERTTQEIDAASAAVPAQDPPLRIAFLYLRSTAITMLAGPGSGADALITAIGGEDAGTAAGVDRDFVSVTSEAMITAAPDVLLTMTDGLESIGGVEGLEKIPGVAQTPAGRDGRVVDMSDAVLLSFGPNTGRVLTALSKAVYGEQPG